MAPDALTPIITEVVRSLAAVLVAAVTVGLPVWLRLRGIGRDVSAAKEQVTNAHATNLRDDVDELRADVAGLALDVRRIARRLDREHDEILERPRRRTLPRPPVPLSLRRAGGRRRK